MNLHCTLRSADLVEDCPAADTSQEYVPAWKMRTDEIVRTLNTPLASWLIATLAADDKSLMLEWLHTKLPITSLEQLRVTSDPTRAGPGAVRETTGGGGDVGASETGGVDMAEVTPISPPVVISAVAGAEGVPGAEEGSEDVSGAEEGSEDVSGAEEGSEDVSGAEEGSEDVSGAEEDSVVTGAEDASGAEEGSVDTGAVEVSVVSGAEDVGIAVDGAAELATGVVETI